MKKDNVVHVTTVTSLEVGDLFVFHSLTSIYAGIVTAICLNGYDLGDDELDYMLAKGLDVPTNKLNYLDSPSTMLVFFKDANSYGGGDLRHVYLDFSDTVVVFDQPFSVTKN